MRDREFEVFKEFLRAAAVGFLGTFVSIALAPTWGLVITAALLTAGALVLEAVVMIPYTLRKGN